MRGSFLQRAAHQRKMLHVGARADVDMQAGDRKAIAARSIKTLGNLGVPYPVLCLFAAGVRFLAVTVAETGIDSQSDVSIRRADAKLVDHVRRAAIDVDVAFHAQIERFGVEDVGRVDDRRRIAGRGIAGAKRTANLARAHGIDQRALATHEVHDGQVGTRLLGVAHHVEGGQIGNPPADRGGVVDERRRAEPPGQLDRGHAGNCSARGRHESITSCQVFWFPRSAWEPILPDALRRTPNDAERL